MSDWKMNNILRRGRNTRRNAKALRIRRRRCEVRAKIAMFLSGDADDVIIDKHCKDGFRSYISESDIDLLQW